MNFAAFWDSGRAAPISARVALAGDFLPAGALVLPSAKWRGAANKLSAHFDDVDVGFVNLECPLDIQGIAARPLNGLGQTVSGDSASLEYLSALRCRIVSLANNHAYDFGPLGLDRTRAVVMLRGMVPLGAGHSLCDAPETFVWHGPGNIRIGFWAAARASRELATRRRSGVEPATIARANEAQRRLREHGATFFIALVHAGVLRTGRPDPSDLTLVDGIARSGFGIVAASHSHLISGAKLLRHANGAPSACFYGLGTIASGYIASALEREGLIVIASFHNDATLARIEVRPALLAVDGFGEIPRREQSSMILSRFQQLSAEIADGSFRKLFYRDAGRNIGALYFRDASAAFRHGGMRGLIRKAGRVRLRHIRRAVHGLLG